MSSLENVSIIRRRHIDGTWSWSHRDKHGFQEFKGSGYGLPELGEYIRIVKIQRSLINYFKTFKTEITMAAKRPLPARFGVLRFAVGSYEVSSWDRNDNGKPDGIKFDECFNFPGGKVCETRLSLEGWDFEPLISALMFAVTE